MNRRDFIVLSAFLPLLVPSSAYGFWPAFIARGILRYSFRALTRRAFSRISTRTIRRSISRTSRHIYRPNRIQNTFRPRRYNILGKKGRVVGTAQIETDVMVLRNTQGQALGYIQAENKALTVYDSSGSRVITFKKKNDRVVAYNKDEDYLGQIIENMVEDKIKSYFIDKQGMKHDHIPVEFSSEHKPIMITDKNTRIFNGKLEIFDTNNTLVMYGIYKDNNILIYNLNNNIIATINKQDGVLFVYNKNGIKMDGSNEGVFINVEY